MSSPPDLWWIVPFIGAYFFLVLSIWIGPFSFQFLNIFIRDWNGTTHVVTEERRCSSFLWSPLLIQRLEWRSVKRIISFLSFALLSILGFFWCSGIQASKSWAFHRLLLLANSFLLTNIGRSILYRRSLATDEMVKETQTLGTQGHNEIVWAPL